MLDATKMVKESLQNVAQQRLTGSRRDIFLQNKLRNVGFISKETNSKKYRFAFCYRNANKRDVLVHYMILTMQNIG